MATADPPDIPVNQRMADLWGTASAVNRALLIGMVVLLAVGVSLLSLSPWQGSEAMVPLLGGHEFPEAERNAAIRAFNTETLTDYQLVGGQILVPAARQNVYLAAMSAGDALPGNFYQAFDDYINKQHSWWMSQTESQRLFLVAKQRSLSQIIASFPDVTTAAVNVTDPPRLGMRRTGVPKAMVKVSTQGNRPLSPTRIEQIKNLVAHAFENLNPESVFVAGDVGPGSGMGGAGGIGSDGACVNTEAIKLKNEYLQTKEAFAECIRMNLQRLFPYLEGVNVVANVELDPERNIKKRTVSFEKGPMATSDTTTRNSTTGAADTVGGEPGVRTNVDLPGQAPNTGATAASSANEETDETSRVVFDNIRHESTSETQDFLPKRVGVVINVPRRYLASATAPAAGTTGATGPTVNQQDIIDSVIKLGYPGLTEDSIQIVPYDEPPVEEVTPEPFNMWVMVWDNSASLAYVLLALLAIVVAIIIARRAPLPADAMAGVHEEPEHEEERPAPALPLVKEDEQSKRFGQYKEGVTQIITTQPEMAASLVRRWITQET